MFYGPAYWRFMHHFALHNIGLDLMKDLGQFINCSECSSEYEPPSDTDNLIIWSKNLHNKVNAKLGKWDKWDMDDFNIGQKPDCDICAKKEIFGYPWLFIHNVAEAGNSNAIPFLQSFNQLYPCSIHNGVLLSDPPLDGESALEWTDRNHKRIDATFQLPNSSPCSNCTPPDLPS